MLRTLAGVDALTVQAENKPRSQVVLSEIIEGEVSDLLFQIIASPTNVLLQILDLSGRTDPDLETPRQLTIRFDAPTTLTIDGVPAGWPLWEGLPQVTWAKGNP